ncbi:Hpt domain-containing protein [Methylovirgula sp. HY1]|uniref:Hpt domain-containing protein n=1 Tax=Methylovirgula sp. HY1 TaxID=2822761 RepID=UPI001C5AE37D|nr:Hpt domain-containing protein [Methylovirgula sp. HY1]QXX76360.1 hypothetical protein MHY1_03200 [Methylovirgula sp. HY1]
MHPTARPAAPATRPILLDLVHLSRQTADDLDLQRELLELFQHQAPDLIARMRALMQDQASAEPQAVLCNLVHQLKGSALAIGAFLLAETAAETERDLAEKTNFSISGTGDTALLPLAAVLAQSLAAIDDYISKLKI